MTEQSSAEILQKLPQKCYARITGTGSYLPPNRVTNADLVTQLAATGVETNDDWIVERTGIRARHFSEAGVMTSELAVAAAENALHRVGIAGRPSAQRLEITSGMGLGHAERSDRLAPHHLWQPVTFLPLWV